MIQFSDLNVQCPLECPVSPIEQKATQGTSADYTITSRTITFPANVLQMPVSITVHNDNDKEPREYFCLSVADSTVRGSQYSTRIYIPWNDGMRKIHATAEQKIYM